MKKYFKCSKIKILSSLDICWRSQIFDAWCGWKIKTWYGKVCEMHKNAHEIYFLPSQPIETPLGKKYYTYIPSAKRRREAKHPYLLTCQLVYFFWKKTPFFSFEKYAKQNSSDAVPLAVSVLHLEDLRLCRSPPKNCLRVRRNSPGSMASPNEKTNKK